MTHIERRVAVTQSVAELLQRYVLAYDCYPNQGAITIRDPYGFIWEISINRSDASKLACEMKPK